MISFAAENKLSLVPRTAGTSLAGQCVGEGIIVDTSKYFTRILAFDERNKTVRVEPGVVRDELNVFLKPTHRKAVNDLLMLKSFFLFSVTKIILN